MTMEVFPSAVSDSLLDRDAFLTRLLNQLNEICLSKEPSWLEQVKSNATKWVRHSVIPTTRDEEWRFTDLSPLRELSFALGSNLGSSQKIAMESLMEGLDLSEATHRLVFIDGVFTPILSQTSDLPSGLHVGNLDTLEDSVAQKYLAQFEGTRDVFSDLNTAGLSDVAVVWAGKNVVVEDPIQLLFISLVGESPTFCQPRCLVIAEGNSQISLIEEHITLNTPSLQNNPMGAGFNNSVTEIWLHENAQVNHSRIVLGGDHSFDIGKTAITQARYSRYSCNAITIGGKISRHNLEIVQTGEQTETDLHGLTVIAQKQLGDTHSAIALNYPYATSKQLHKLIIGDRAHGVFNGKIFVPKSAQLTDASQLNRNLLLSSKARVDTKPQLEITADNVKCAHGATVSQLEDDEIFYLQSRGIGEIEARKLLVNAFATEVINLIPIASLREKLLKTVSSLVNK